MRAEWTTTRWIIVPAPIIKHRGKEGGKEKGLGKLSLHNSGSKEKRERDCGADTGESGSRNLVKLQAVHESV